MSRSTIAAFVLLIAGLAGIHGVVRHLTEPDGAGAPGWTLPGGSWGHVVTTEMTKSSRAMVERAALPFEAPATDGKLYKSEDLRRRGPVVLTFIKDGCPCSESAQPFFNRVHDAYPRAAFLGVINTRLAAANRWASRSRVAYPILIDPGSRIMRDYGAENSAYVVVVDGEGRIRKHWPGYSSGMLRELGAILAELTGSAVKPIDLADAPREEYSGCPFDLE